MAELVPIILGLFFVAAALRVDFYFKIVYLVAAVYFFARFWVKRVALNLHARRQLINRAFPGEHIEVALKIENRGWLPVPWLEVNELLPLTLAAAPFEREVIVLGPHAAHTFKYRLFCRKRGYYNIGPLRIYTGDLWGIKSVRSQHLSSEHVIVYPWVVPLSQLGLPTRSPLAALPSPAPLFEDPSRIMGVRDYQAGDSPRRIHWTATASAGRLLVKRYEPAIARDSLICLDMNVDDYAFKRRFDAVELAIITTASIANHIITREGLAAGLATYAWDPLLEQDVSFSLPPHREKAHLMGILEVLARIEGVKQRTPESAFPDLVRRESMGLNWGATIVLVTGAESPALFDTLAYLRRSGFAVALILVLPDKLPGAGDMHAGILGVPTYRVWNEKDLEMWGG